MSGFLEKSPVAVLHVGAVFALSHHGRHTAGVVIVSDQILADGLIMNLAAEILGKDVGVGLRLQRRAKQCPEGLILVPEIVRCGRHREHPRRIRVARLKAAMQAARLHMVDSPVDRLSRVIDPALPLLLVHEVRACRLLHLHDMGSGLGSVIDTELLLNLRPDGMVRATAADRLRAGREHHYIGTFLGSRYRCA